MMRRIVVLFLVLISNAAFSNEKASTKSKKATKKKMRKSSKQSVLDLNYITPRMGFTFDVKTELANVTYIEKSQPSEHPTSDYKNSLFNIYTTVAFAPMRNLEVGLDLDLSLKNKIELEGATKTDGTAKQLGLVNNTDDDFYNQEQINNWGLADTALNVKYRLMEDRSGIFDFDVLLGYSPKIKDAKRGFQYEALDRFYATDGNSSRGTHQFILGGSLYKQIQSLQLGAYIVSRFNSSSDVTYLEGDYTNVDESQRKDLVKSVESYTMVEFGVSGQFFFTPTIAMKVFADFSSMPSLTSSYSVNQGQETLQYSLEEVTESYLRSDFGIEASMLATSATSLFLGTNITVLPEFGTTKTQTEISDGDVTQLTPTEQVERSGWAIYLGSRSTF